MRKFPIDLWTKTEYHHPLSYGFIPKAMLYLHDDNVLRPCMVVVPGGGYEYLSASESEIVALEFYKRGYHAAVCTYTTNLATTIPVGDQAIYDLSRTIRLIRKNGAGWHINTNAILVCGFSAGGHLCGSLCVHWADICDSDNDLNRHSNRPDGAILAYPVITSGAYAHRESFLSLLGADSDPKKLEYYSLEKQVSKETPPCFIWQTAGDALVPVENSYLFAEACRKQRVPYAHHIFWNGAHGISLANDVWASGNFGGDFVEEQSVELVKRVRSKELFRPGRALSELDRFDNMEAKQQLQKGLQSVWEVAIWPELADQWIQKVILAKN